MDKFWRGFLEGPNFQFVLFWLLRILAVITAICGVFFWIGSLIQILQRFSPGLFLGGIIFLGLMIVAVIFLIKTLWKRARDIRDLPGGDFPIFDIFAAVIRLIGEISAIILGFMGVGGMFLIWGGGRSALDIIGFMINPILRLFGPYSLIDPVRTISLGLLIFMAYTLSAVLTLLGSYFISELVTLTKCIYQNTQPLPKNTNQV
jgi:hypothetical protein